MQPRLHTTESLLEASSIILFTTSLSQRTPGQHHKDWKQHSRINSCWIQRWTVGEVEEEGSSAYIRLQSPAPYRDGLKISFVKAKILSTRNMNTGVKMCVYISIQEYIRSRVLLLVNGHLAPSLEPMVRTLQLPGALNEDTLVLRSTHHEDQVYMRRPLSLAEKFGRNRRTERGKKCCNAKIQPLDVAVSQNPFFSYRIHS